MSATVAFATTGPDFAGWTIRDLVRVQKLAIAQINEYPGNPPADIEQYLIQTIEATSAEIARRGGIAAA